VSCFNRSLPRSMCFFNCPLLFVLFLLFSTFFVFIHLFFFPTFSLFSFYLISSLFLSISVTLIIPHHFFLSFYFYFTFLVETDQLYCSTFPSVYVCYLVGWLAKSSLPDFLLFHLFCSFLHSFVSFISIFYLLLFVSLSNC